MVLLEHDVAARVPALRVEEVGDDHPVHTGLRQGPGLSRSILGKDEKGKS